MKKIPLTQGKYTSVDDTDFEWLNQWKWCVSKAGRRWYATRNDYSGGNKVVRMHNIIMGESPSGMTVDHINGNSLDNRRENLRFCTQAENVRNRRKPNVNKYKYKGVRKIGKRWRAIIGHNGKVKHLGMFDTQEEAARAYDTAAKELFGDFAFLNFQE